MEKHMTIQEVSEWTGLPKSTLRYWEKELSRHIRPERTPGGQRRYSIEHIQMFKEVQHLKKHGKKMIEIRQLFNRQNSLTSDYSDPSKLSVEILAKRIAELVSNEVSQFLSAQRQDADQ